MSLEAQVELVEAAGVLLEQVPHVQLGRFAVVGGQGLPGRGLGQCAHVCGSFPSRGLTAARLVRVVRLTDVGLSRARMDAREGGRGNARARYWSIGPVGASSGGRGRGGRTKGKHMYPGEKEPRPSGSGLPLRQTHSLTLAALYMRKPCGRTAEGPGISGWARGWRVRAGMDEMLAAVSKGQGPRECYISHGVERGLAERGDTMSNGGAWARRSGWSSPAASRRCGSVCGRRGRSGST